MKTIFTFDLERGYQPNDILNYRKIIHRLSETYPWNFEFRQEVVKNTHEDWIKLQTRRSLKEIDLYSSKLIIGFELCENTTHIRTTYGLPYLNFMTSKIRFPGLEDTIMVESNLDIGPSITNFCPFIPAKNCYVNPINEYTKFEGKTIALGQMYGDRSVIFDGKSHSIFDYDFQADIYRPHPHAVLYQPEFHQKQVQLAKERGLEVIQEGNIYQILHSCKKVIGISSSTLYEAELMGKQVDFLNEKDYIRNGKIIFWNQIDEKFWEHIRSQA